MRIFRQFLLFLNTVKSTTVIEELPKKLSTIDGGTTYVLQIFVRAFYRYHVSSNFCFF